MTIDRAGVGPMDDEKLLEVRDLHVTFKTEEGRVQAVRGLDLDLDRGLLTLRTSVSGAKGSPTRRVPWRPTRVWAQGSTTTATHY